MKKAVLSALVAFASLLIALVTFAAFLVSGDALLGFMCICSLCAVVTGLVGFMENTRFAERLASMFGKEGEDDE